MRKLIFVLLCFAPAARADSLMPSLTNVASYLQANSALPITQQADLQLSRNLLTAQAVPSCTYCGSNSLLLSENAVLRAITLYVWTGGPTSISSATLEPVVWTQSTIAINPDATVSLTPTSLDFGKELVVSTPEPSLLLLLALGSVCLLLSWFVSRRVRQSTAV